MEQKQETSAKPVTMLTVVQICERCDLSPVYVKRALQHGWLEGEKRLMSGTQVEQWVAAEPVVEAWRKSCESHKASKSGFSGSAKQIRELQAYVKDAKPQDIAALRKSLGIE